MVSDDDAHLKLVDRAVRLVGEIGSIGATIIDLLPICARVKISFLLLIFTLMHSVVRYVPAWFPGMGLKRHALKTREVVDQVIEGPFSEAKNRKVSGIITHGKLTSYNIHVNF